MSWSIFLLEVFEVIAILSIGFSLYKLWRWVLPLRRVLGILKMWDELITKYEESHEKKDQTIKELRKAIRDLNIDTK